MNLGLKEILIIIIGVVVLCILIFRCNNGECNPENIPDCLAIGAYPVCTNGEWNCGSVCDAYNIPKCNEREVLNCMNGEWKCIGENVPFGILKSFKRNCDSIPKPDCEYPVCINGGWKCLKNTEGGCNLSNKIDCADGKEPICANGNWVCLRESSTTMTCTLKTSNTLEQPHSMRPQTNTQSAFGVNDPFSDPTKWVPIWTNSDLTPANASYAVGFSSQTIDVVWLPGFATGNFTQFTYFEKINPTPVVAIDVKWDNINTNVLTKTHRIMLVMFDASPSDSSTGTLNAGVLYSTELAVGPAIVMTSPIQSVNGYVMQRNVSYNPSPKSIRKVGFALTFDIIDSDLFSDNSELSGFNSKGAQQFFKIMSGS